MRVRSLALSNAVPHRYDATLSDISGQDIEAHGNDAGQVIARVRDWLNVNRASGSPPLPGAAALSADFADCLDVAGSILALHRLDGLDVLGHADFLFAMQEALVVVNDRRRSGA